MEFFKQFIANLSEVYQQNERLAGPILFMGGFAYDALTITRIDRLLENAFLMSYLIILGVSIVLVARLKQPGQRLAGLSDFKEYFPLVIQFLLGGLLSVYVIFYFRSTSLTVSAIYLLLLVVLLILNELLQNRLMNLSLLVSLYFFVWFSYSVFFLPVLLGKMGPSVFWAGVIFSLLPTGLVIYGMYGNKLRDHLRSVFKHLVGVLSLLTVILVLYVQNAIPPVPLALRSGGIYHHVEKEGQRYVLEKVKPTWSESIELFGRTVPWRPGQTIYSYVSVFAPAELDTPIRHQWQVYRKDKGWVTTDDLTYSIQGGRRGGYRGYTFKKNLHEGDWRVNILTGSGRLLGRLTFRLKERRGDEPLPRKRIIR